MATLIGVYPVSPLIFLFQNLLANLKGILGMWRVRESPQSPKNGLYTQLHHPKTTMELT